MKLTYWTAENLNDHNCYSIRARTKKEAKAIKAIKGEGDYGLVTKVVVEYKDGFDLMAQCLDEGGLLPEKIAQAKSIRKQFNY